MQKYLKEAIESIRMAEGTPNRTAKSETDPSLKPPKKWWEATSKSVKSGNPSYSQDQVDKTVGKIWSDLSDAKKSEIRGREGKTFGEAKESSLQQAIKVIAAEAAEDENIIFGVDEKNNIVYYKVNPPGDKFPDNVVQHIYKLTVGQGKGDQLGDVNFGMYYKISFDPPLRVAEDEENIWQEPAAILRETSDGMVACDYYLSEEDADRAWDEIERRYEEFLAGQGIGE